MYSHYIYFCLSLSLISSALTAQTDLPVLYTTDSILDIRVENELRPKSWTIAPHLRPDPYTSNVVGQTITFISDLDSISCVVNQAKVFDFVVVRGTDSAFTRVVYEPTKLDILKTYSEYEPSQLRDIPAFTYESSDSPPLKALREKYQLDSIAGQGNDVSQMLNLMRWVHNLIEHDGNKPNIGKRNADAFLSTCSNGRGSLNCRGLGIVLNEVYLSMGFPSRYVTCLPRDTNDVDCHVINTAYSHSLNKWIWLDPTQNAYAMDEQGELLSIPEVRERLIKDQTLILNPDANWNYRGTTDKAWYLEYYMAKNLYRFSTPLHSTYNFETKEKGKQLAYVELWPAGTGTNLLPVSKEQTKDEVIWVTYRTNNPELFWTAPVEIKRK